MKLRGLIGKRGRLAQMGRPRPRSVARGADRPDDGARLTRMANLSEDQAAAPPEGCPESGHDSPSLQVFGLLCCSLKVNEHTYDN